MVPGSIGGLGYKIDGSGIVPPLPGQSLTSDPTLTIIGSGNTVCGLMQSPNIHWHLWNYRTSTTLAVAHLNPLFWVTAGSYLVHWELRGLLARKPISSNLVRGALEFHSVSALAAMTLQEGFHRRVSSSTKVLFNASSSWTRWMLAKEYSVSPLPFSSNAWTPSRHYLQSRSLPGIHIS